MIDLYELRQLMAFADLGTLSRVAEEFHISTPSVTRSMQHLEDAFGVTLFHRGKNKIELNETGLAAVEHARKLLSEAEQAVQQVRDFDRRHADKEIFLQEGHSALDGKGQNGNVAGAVLPSGEHLLILADCGGNHHIRPVRI